MIRKLPKESRGRKRASISLPVKYSEPAGAPQQKKSSMAADISDSGLGIYADKEIKPGTLLEIECEDIWEQPKKFTVKWCSRIQYNYFRLGLEAKE